jgi:hypothetical protein
MVDRPNGVCKILLQMVLQKVEKPWVQFRQDHMAFQQPVFC